IIEMAQRNALIQEYINSSPVKDFFKGIGNDFVITAKTMMSGPLGYSKASVTDLDGNIVGYNRRMSAGVNAFTSLVPISGAPKGLTLANESFTAATGGLKQWIRIGPSHSVSGDFPTFSLRWGAGGKHWK